MTEVKEEVEVESAENGSQVNAEEGIGKSLEESENLDFKQELSDDKVALHTADPLEQTVPGVVFKKRKAKNIRQK